ncbi:MAG: exo-alpha-sialidase [Candidatus Hydrogenedentes bacterium]|nr:exo-alpha-sialidase [Candidatus Hydrogenedentota bacterium]
MIARLLSCLALAAAFAAPALESELIFPMNPMHNHGSSIVETPEGDLIACWFHGTGERKSDDVVIQGARKRQGADTWSEPFLMADTPDLPDCNPVLFIDPRGTLWLFWIAVQDNEWGGSLLKYRTAANYQNDGPPEWDWQDVIHTRPLNLEPKMNATLDQLETEMADLLAGAPRIQGLIQQLRDTLPIKIHRRLGWMTRIKPIMTSENRMMLGLYSDVWNSSLAVFTEDWGQTWTTGEPALTMQLGNIQPAFAQRKNGEIVMYMRDNGLPKKIRQAVSNDGGVTWGPVTAMDIPNPGASVDVLVLQSGHWALICNDADGRHIATVYLSEDEGQTWPVSRRIEDFEKDAGSASYFALIQGKDGVIHTTYSYKNADTPGSAIKHVAFDEGWIRGE